MERISWDEYFSKIVVATSEDRLVMITCRVFTCKR